MWPLTDITVYYEGGKDPSTEFRFEMNYISDMYHNRLERYKPPKTARICLHLRHEKRTRVTPIYFGAICSYDAMFDFQKYEAIAKKRDRYKFIVDLIHET